MVIILLSLLLMALFSALMAAFFIEMKLREEMGMNSINTNNHVLIIGWNMKGSDIIRRLQTKDQFKGTEVVILADMDSKPVDSDAVFFVRYSGLLDGNHLDKAAIKSARKIIILADYAVKFGADMFTIAHCLLARKHNPDAQIIVEMLNLLTREYFEASGATDIISVGELGGLMITESCLDGSNEMQTILNKIGR